MHGVNAAHLRRAAAASWPSVRRRKRTCGAARLQPPPRRTARAAPRRAPSPRARRTWAGSRRWRRCPG
jgi:hypothetical protein